MAEMNEQHFETIDENKDRLYQKKKRARRILNKLLTKYTKRELLEMIDKDAHG